MTTGPAAPGSTPLDPSVAARLTRDAVGLVPAVVQQHDTGEVLMLGWMDDEALHRTLTTGRATYWSRSRQEYWRKGDTSGHVQQVCSVALDCDGDTLLVRVDQVGAACHTGDRTCFDADVLLAAARVGGARMTTAAGGRSSSAPPAQAPDLAFGRTWPSLDTFGVLARDRRVIPVVRRLMADGETPVGLYRKLAGEQPGTFLLESADHDGVWSRWSIVGVASRATLTEVGGLAHWVGEPPAGVPTDGPATEVLRATMAALATEPVAGLPPLTGGMVGVIGYDAVRHWERVPDDNPDDLGLPELAMLLATDLAVLDHADGSVLLVANAVNYDDTDDRVEQAWADAVARLDTMTAALAAPALSTVAVVDERVADEALAQVRTNTSRARYEEIVELAKEDIRAGEVFQVVLSQRFSIDCPADPLEVYRVLRASNPSPYMYLFRLPTPQGGSFAVVGSSPEALVRVTGGRAVTHPIAGSRPRGKTPDDDVRLAEELLADPKERAEHVMLVDLGRNDLQRVCRPGTVDVVEFMQVRRYSHVTHLESTVAGDSRAGVNAYDVLASTFPAGTLSGAPKPRAMALVDRYEGSRRGVYGGVVGYLDFHGDLDMAIAIRTAVIKDGVAHVQAGAGIVADSVPANEHAECEAKAAAVLRAVATASALRTVTTGMT